MKAASSTQYLDFAAAICSTRFHWTYMKIPRVSPLWSFFHLLHCHWEIKSVFMLVFIMKYIFRQSVLQFSSSKSFGELFEVTFHSPAYWNPFRKCCWTQSRSFIPHSLYSACPLASRAAAAAAHGTVAGGWLMVHSLFWGKDAQEKHLTK